MTHSWTFVFYSRERMPSDDSVVLKSCLMMLLGEEDADEFGHIIDTDTAIGIDIGTDGTA